MKSKETHISSVIIHIEPNYISDVIEHLLKIPSLDVVPPEKNQGKLIVVIEAQSEKSTSDYIEMMKAMKGVLSVAMVYHQVEDSNSLDQEIIAVSDNI